MFFDFTEEISLNANALKTYRLLRGLFFAGAILLALYLAVLILFPSRYFYFDFTKPTDNANNIVSPRDGENSPAIDGKISEEKSLVFDTMINENFPEASVDFSLNGNYVNPLSGSISIQKTYRALFYPTGSPIGFKDGTLLKAGADRFIISDDLLRKFSNSAIKNLGYGENQFTQISAEDLKHNVMGEFIDKDSDYPNNSLFKISDNFYMLHAGKLRPFTSPTSFNSQYDPAMAMEKNEDFLGRYPLDENPIGFSDGSLISYADSVFIVSEGQIFPIDNPQTFLDNGFDFADVIPANADEIALYERTKLFNKTSISPTGVVFSSIESPGWFMIKDEKKLPVPSEKVLASWLRKKPVLFSQNEASSCQIKKSGYFFQKNNYTCRLRLSEAGPLYGNAFQFAIVPDTDVQISVLNVTYSRAISVSNLKKSLVSLYNKIVSNYYAPVQ